MAVANEQQRDSFIHDVIGREEAAALLGESFLESDSGGVMLVAGVPQGKKPGAVHEDVSRAP